MILHLWKARSTSFTASAIVARTLNVIAASFQQTAHFSQLASPLNLNLSEPVTRPELKALVLSHYHEGKFHNLFHEVVALPSVLLLACQNLKQANHGAHKHIGTLHEPPQLSLNCVSTHFFSLQQLSSQLSEDKFDIESCCFSIPSSSTYERDSLVLPNLLLKVVIEAIRMVFEIVYDDRFVTFCYGGRVDMGRHTAIRYLKNSLENPSWWFSVSFSKKKFGSQHVDKLCVIIGSKIKDNAMIDTIKKLFETGVLSIEVGGCYLGRGFVQECSLISILINIYFHGLDQEIQELRLKINRGNPRFDDKELAIGVTNSVSFRPIKMYAVRYLDEILIATSGTKMLMMELKNKFEMYLEKDMELSVDKVKTVIRSALSDNIVFLGMELQAVTPSVLRPSLSEKAIRARRKHLRQKEVERLELRNAKETNRKKLGMKIMSHLFKKLKKSSGSKSDFQIENEVRQIFNTWGDEVVQEYLESVEERAQWYRRLSGGDFLSLERIRNQLPPELVSAYDNFQEQVVKYLNPIKAKRALEEKERLREEQEEQKYAARTVEDLTKLCIKVDAPIELVRKAVQNFGFTNHMGRPRPISLLMALEDADIVKWYAGVGRRWLDYFCCCHNFKNVKTVVSYHLRFSCLLTLAEKHESTKKEAIQHYTKDLKTLDLNGSETMYFPTEREVAMMRDGNLADPKPVDGAITMALIRLASDEPPYRCVAHFCNRTDTTVYRIRLLESDLNQKNKNGRKKVVLGMGSIHQSMNKKCLPLCSDHISELYLGRLTLQDIDCTSFVDVD
ncbi:hypothetical protein LIER_33597 [Lithospermum erythrorhizon]|uniref:Domain X domain-containing protein n=1 Tax=Lithospermum erythrorhizon TaxID=34254 RepID=A0AAV3RY34_LITER